MVPAVRHGSPPGLLADLLALAARDVEHLEGVLLDIRYTLERGGIELDREQAAALAGTLSRIEEAAGELVRDALRRRTALEPLPGQLPAFEELERPRMWSPRSQSTS